MKALTFGIGLAVFFLGVSTVCGYAIGLASLYRWSSDGGTGMAFNTGVGFMLTGFAICILSSRSHAKVCDLPPPIA